MTDPYPTSETLDAFHRGRFHLIQPKGKGHRAGLDAMLLASLVPDSASGTLADFGAGAGAAGFAVASRIKTLRVMLVERAPSMVQLARRSVALSENRHLADRMEVIEADVTSTGAHRIAMGLSDSAFDHVVMNPPFNDQRDRTTPDTLKAEAHAMDGPVFADWIRTAGAVARPGGQLSLIARPQSLMDILTACENRFGAIQLTPVHPRPGEDAVRLLLSAIKGSRTRLSLRPPLFVHEHGGREFSPNVDALCNGLASIER
ncbi:MAG: methyltransferase [Alphaproteobacteria bacterium]|nr:methyltransferase [Alphaproteobacteria bacterium]